MPKYGKYSVRISELKAIQDRNCTKKKKIENKLCVLPRHCLMGSSERCQTNLPLTHSLKPTGVLL